MEAICSGRLALHYMDEDDGSRSGDLECQARQDENTRPHHGSDGEGQDSYQPQGPTK